MCRFVSAHLNYFHAQLALRSLNTLKIPHPPFEKRMLNSPWHRNTKIMHNRSIIKMMVAATFKLLLSYHTLTPFTHPPTLLKKRKKKREKINHLSVGLSSSSVRLDAKQRTDRFPRLALLSTITSITVCHPHPTPFIPSRLCTGSSLPNNHTPSPINLPFPPPLHAHRFSLQFKFTYPSSLSKLHLMGGGGGRKQ